MQFKWIKLEHSIPHAYEKNFFNVHPVLHGQIRNFTGCENEWIYRWTS